MQQKDSSASLLTPLADSLGRFKNIWHSKASDDWTTCATSVGSRYDLMLLAVTLTSAKYMT